jgi:hypothetical protein
MIAAGKGMVCEHETVTFLPQRLFCFHRSARCARASAHDEDSAGVF